MRLREFEILFVLCLTFPTIRSHGQSPIVALTSNNAKVHLFPSLVEIYRFEGVHHRSNTE